MLKLMSPLVLAAAQVPSPEVEAPTTEPPGPAPEPQAPEAPRPQLDLTFLQESPVGTDEKREEHDVGQAPAKPSAPPRLTRHERREAQRHAIPALFNRGFAAPDLPALPPGVSPFQHLCLRFRALDMQVTPHRMDTPPELQAKGAPPVIDGALISIVCFVPAGVLRFFDGALVGPDGKPTPHQCLAAPPSVTLTVPESELSPEAAAALGLVVGS